MRCGTNHYVFTVIVCLLLCVNFAEGWMPEWDHLAASDASTNDYFGQSVSISGDYAVIGAYADDDNGSNSGSAYIFKREGKRWNEQAKLVASDGNSNDYFGYSVFMRGDYVIVGAYNDDDNGSNSGSAYIFSPNELDPNNWDEVAKLTASDGEDSDNFGYSVSMLGDYIIIGAQGDDDNGPTSGSAYIFKRDGTGWNEQAKLLASDGYNYDQFGYTVSIGENCAIVGALSDDDHAVASGSAYIYAPNEVDPNNWDQVVKLTASDWSEGAQFGNSVYMSINGDYAVIGSRWHENRSGSVYIFKRDGTSWSEHAKLKASDAADNDYFGYSVSISEGKIIVGAYGDDDNGSNSGSAYIFGPNEIDPNNWDQTAKLTASDGAYNDSFGSSVSISGDFAIVGAWRDEYSGMTAAGSAYAFSNVSCPVSDLNDDCFVDFKDLAVLAGEWLQGL